MRPAVSVIVLVYGVEEYIEKCARSLFGQTMEDLEFIIVDDCTQDRSMEILYSVLEDYPRRKDQVKVIHNEVNRGQAYSRRVGVEAATGEYIIHCDSDDWVDLDMYAKMYSKARECNLDLVICQLAAVDHGHTDVIACSIGSEDILGDIIKGCMSPSLMNKLFSRMVYEKGVVYPRCNYSEDYAMTAQLVSNCTSFEYLYEPLYYYLAREGSISDIQTSIQKTLQIKESLDLVITSLEARGLDMKYRDAILYAKSLLKYSAIPLPRKDYLNVYPELNVSILFNKSVPFEKRLGHLTHLLGIHGVSKLFKKK